MASAGSLLRRPFVYSGPRQSDHELGLPTNRKRQREDERSERHDVHGSLQGKMGLGRPAGARWSTTLDMSTDSIRCRSATGRPHPEHRVCLYLLRGVAVVRPEQVRSGDIIYIRVEHRFAYLAAVIGWYSRWVLACRPSHHQLALVTKAVPPSRVEGRRWRPCP